MRGEIVESYPKDQALLQDYNDKAVQCCINKWNQLCPEYPIAKSAGVLKRKRWGFFGPDVTVIEKSGNCREVSKIVFSINNRLTSKSIQKNQDSILIHIACRIWWNYDGYLVRGWLNNIVVDVVKDQVVSFPQITPTSPYWEHFM